MIKAVLFDFDDTIVKTIDAVYNAYKFIADNKGLKFPAFDEFTSFSFGFREFENFVGLTQLDEGIFLDAYSRFEHLEQPFEDSLEVLQKLKRDGFKLGIASSASWKRINSAIHRFGIADFFDDIVTTMDGLKPKPDPHVLIVITEKLGVKAEESVYIGDAVSDIVAAKSAGMISIGLLREMRRKDYFDQAKPDAVFENLYDAYDFIKGVR